MTALHPLILFFAWVLTLAVVVMTLVCGLFIVRGQFDAEFFKGLGLLLLFLVLLMGCFRALTGRWHRWSRNHATR
ncbi:hypothetical protein [Streptomyces cremeus]|uniref:Uncharacterized protein n=1 Tax=Streptomyces cremeus TaxID=66881 RepID=A0ABV5PA23_STRCM